MHITHDHDHYLITLDGQSAPQDRTPLHIGSDIARLLHGAHLCVTHITSFPEKTPDVADTASLRMCAGHVYSVAHLKAVDDAHALDVRLTLADVRRLCGEEPVLLTELNTNATIEILPYEW